MGDFGESYPERTTQKIQFTIKDEAGVAIPAASLSTCTLKLYDAATQAAIGTATRDVLTSVDAAGLLALTLGAADSPILNDDLVVEVHVALFEWTYNGVIGRGQFVALLGVVNASKVP